jgi:anti-sigma regulatory factor (Ser/Thr protein kinase)
LESNNLKKEIEKLKLKLRREIEGRRHIEDIYEKTRFLLQSSKEEIERLSYQLTHDIRPPLISLIDISSEALHLMPTEKQNVFISTISRVKEISDQLLDRHKKKKFIAKDLNCDPVNIILHVNRIVAEKKLTSQSNFSVEVQSNVSFYSRIKDYEIENMISNIINNAIEASRKVEKPKIVVFIFQDSEKNCISITDNGVGILPSALGKIGTYGHTTKENGNGLGLYNAIQLTEKRGGDVIIKSDLGHGTTVTVRLPNAQREESKIDIGKYSSVVVIEDDQLFHEKINLILSSINFKGHIINFYSTDEFENWYRTLGENERKGKFYIVDGFIGGDIPTGLKLIKNYDLENNCILYTGRPSVFSEFRDTVRIVDKGSDLSDIFIPL